MYYSDVNADHATATLPRVEVDRPDAARSISADHALQDRVEQFRYPVGAALSAGVATLTAVLAMIIAHGILGLSILTPHDTMLYAIGSAGIAIGAAILLKAMLHVAPHPESYFGALCVLGIAVAAAVPFTNGASLASQTGLAVANLAVGTAIAIFVPLAATRRR